MSEDISAYMRISVTLTIMTALVAVIATLVAMAIVSYNNFRSFVASEVSNSDSHYSDTFLGKLSIKSETTTVQTLNGAELYRVLDDCKEQISNAKVVYETKSIRQIYGTSQFANIYNASSSKNKIEYNRDTSLDEDTKSFNWLMKHGGDEFSVTWSTTTGTHGEKYYVIKALAYEK
jgi:hypothetical protein